VISPWDDSNEPRPQGSPGTPGREAEEVPVDGEAVREPDDDRNLTPSEEGSRPAARPEVDPPDPGSAQVEQDIAALLSDTEQQRDEYLELAKRTQADFENYRKRMAAEVQAASVRGKVELAAQVVSVVDTLEKALEAAGVEPGGGQAPAEPLAEGFFLTYRELCAALARAGVESFDPTGEAFDPNRHEALQKIAIDGAPSGSVVETMQKGYSLGEQLIRPARVMVAA
jgi:molecular chaperone GrpE